MAVFLHHGPQMRCFEPQWTHMTRGNVPDTHRPAAARCERMGGLGLVPGGGSVPAFNTFFRNEVARWAKVGREAGVKIE